MAQLEQGGRGCSIRAIALACGYRHMGLFSSDFKKRFGLTPSAASWRTATPRGGIAREYRCTQQLGSWASRFPAPQH
jgi:AraC-like DNA-binding protein